jgi:hypothetical protein
MTTNATLTRLDLIHAHQATLAWLSTNFSGTSMTTHTVGEHADMYLTPETPAGMTLLRGISRAMGKPVTSDNVFEIALYLVG